MKIAVLGGGPAGLYFAIQLKLRRPECEIAIHERNERGNTFGWGVVFSDETIENFLSADEVTAAEIRKTLHHWDDIDVLYKDTSIRSSGHGFSGVGRHKLLEILESRAEELGVVIHFGSEVEDPKSLKVDIVVAADGIFSKTREKYAEHFESDIDWRECRYTWLGTKKPFDAFTFYFKETEFGWFQAHCYQFNKDTSTFIIETPEEVWKKAGIEELTKDEAINFCEELFSEELDGYSLISNSKHLRGSEAWIRFPRVICKKWYHENIILLGDAAATAHFSIGSGTKLAMESAISLARIVAEDGANPEALARYQEEREVEVFKLQSAARNSTEWFESVERKTKLKPEQFTYSLLTRSQRVSHENLRLRDKGYLEDYESWLTKAECGEDVSARPPMFLPYEVKGLRLENRVVVSPMDMYSAVDGLPGDFHLVHLGSRALGGAGLVYTEMTCVSELGRITPGCAGIYTDEQQAAWKRVVDFVHSNSPAKIAMQIGHAGRKGSTCVAWEGMDKPLPDGNWELFAPSPIPYTAENQVPTEMTADHMRDIKADFVSAAKRADAAGFDLLELHFAHGYLLSSFISPLTNQRSDEYGGSLEKRMRYPLEVFEAVKAIWPEEKPLSVRISASDWVPGGTTIGDSVQVTKMLHELGLDIIDVSAGQVSADQKPVYGRMFQTPFAERIRSEIDITTMAVGNIFEADHVNSIVAAGRADLCLLARPHLANPNWIQHAAAELGFDKQWWPAQYQAGKEQYTRLAEKERLQS